MRIGRGVVAAVLALASGTCARSGFDAWSAADGRDEDGDPAVQAGWYDPAWPARQALTIDPSRVHGSDHTGFPILIEDVQPAWRSVSHGGNVESADARDLRFTAADGTTLLAWEKIHYDPVQGALTAWVRAPVLSADQVTTSYVYFGNPSAPAAGPASDVWIAGYAGVWHLEEDSTASPPQMVDSSPFSNHGSAENGIACGPGILGHTGLGCQFATTWVDGRVSIGRPEALRLPGPFTIEVWAHRTGWNTFAGLVGTASVALGDSVHLDASDVEGEIRCRVKNDPDVFGPTVAAMLPLDTWTYFACLFDGVDVILYRNGVEVGRGAGASFANYDTTTGWYLGWQETNNEFDGTLDEVRISTVARSAGWLVTSHANQSDPAAFVAVGPVEAR